MNTKRILFFWFIIWGHLSSGNAQIVDSTLQAQQGVSSKSHIVFNLNHHNIDEIKSVIRKGKVYAVKFSTSEDKNKSFIELYKKYNEQLIVLSEKEFPKYSSKDLKLRYKTKKDLEAKDLNRNARVPRFIKPGKYSYTKLASNLTEKDSLFYEIWIKSGKRPSFIEFDNLLEEKQDSLLSKLNGVRKVFGMVKTRNNELVSNVKFIGFDDSEINGDFSFPILKKGRNLPILIPYKSGYRFSPDIIYTTPENIRNPKIFRAIPLEIDYGLSNHFTFHSSFKNNVSKNVKSILLRDVEVIKDSVFGHFGYFNNKGFVDAGVESRESLKKSFSISAWIKPTRLGGNNSILGKGDNFVVKLRKGFLTFTMAGVKDYISKFSKVPLNEWSFIALTHSDVDNTLSFYVNGALTEQVELIADYVPTDYNILIGTNLWEEFFEGYIAEVRTWERELSGNEIELLRKNKKASYRNYSLVFGALAVLALLVCVFLVKRRIKRVGSTAKNTFQKEEEPILNNTIKIVENSKEKVLCFGKLKILNKENVDLAERLSPLLKKIFIIVLLYSNSNEANKKGISTKRLTELLWPGMTPQKAKNTRGTNMNNLRIILNDSVGVNLVFRDKHWFIDLSETCYCDYEIIQNYLALFSQQNYSKSVMKNELSKFLKILNKGALFSNVSEPWLDPFVEKFSHTLVEQCLAFSDVLDVENHADLLLLLAEVICIYDDLNEKANQLKLQVFIQQGKLSLANKTYQNYAKLYNKIYKESYPVSFEDISSKYL